MRQEDGSAGDANYGEIGRHYALFRQPEPLIEAAILDALGDAETILNVGAGAGSYEPRERYVTALEPSASMRAQRPAELSVAIDGVAERLPFPDKSFDAALATFTVHQWSDLEAGLVEMRRVSRGPVVILTCDPDDVQAFWLNEYAPDVLAAEARRYPAMARLGTTLGGYVDVRQVPIPLLCRDGFNEAYYGRPEMLLNDAARLSCSAWSFVPDATANEYVRALKDALECGDWDRRYGQLRTQPVYRGSLRLVVAGP
ncbi:MAG: class I SAM-dependent methyltransferase [Hyphomonas sp.]|nr:class I SAM-dependent methyltransferase [Hyphomonas sp.]